MKEGDCLRGGKSSGTEEGEDVFCEMPIGSY